MRRLTLLLLVGITLAAVLAMVLNVVLIRATFDDDDPRAAPALPGPLMRLVGELRSTMDAGGPMTPVVLTKRLGVPAIEVDASAVPSGLVNAPIGEWTLHVSNRDQRDIRRAWLKPASGPAIELNLDDYGGFFTTTRITIILGSILTVGLLFSVLMALPLARGLGRLTTASRALAAGEFETRAPHDSGATAELTTAFNTMAGRIQNLMETHQHLLQAVSHELRTPTARIRFSLELLEDEDDAEERAQRLAAIDRDLTELDELVDELVSYARVAVDIRLTGDEQLPVRATLTELTDDVLHRRSDVTVTVAEGDADVAAMVEPRTFRRAVRNLVLNAVRHSDSVVNVRYRRVGNVVEVTVSDDGEGLAPKDRKRIFEPFIRVDSSRSRESGGVGLGLAIVKRIVEAHGGNVAVDDAPEGGARFVTTWPAAGTNAYKA